MLTLTTLWIPFTLAAAMAQVARNAMQRSLTGPLGTLGATNIRFLFGLPFSLVFLVIVLGVTGDGLPVPPAAFWPWLLLGALTQIAATGMMLAAMNDTSFVATTAYLKTEAIQAAVFGLVFLGDSLSALKVLAILIATAGVLLTAYRPGSAAKLVQGKPILLGLLAAAFFALSAVGYRGAIIHLKAVSFVTASSFTLVMTLTLQTTLLLIYLFWRAPDVLPATFKLWRSSLWAGFVGALGSQFWFLAFALTSAGNVRTLALVEVLFAQFVSWYSFKQPFALRELSGIVLIVAGVGLLIAA